VVCGNAIYEYEHFDPEFKDATEHSADRIALLCPIHHRKKERGLLSEEDYSRAIQSPFAFRHGYAFTDWSIAEFAPQILVGSFTFTGGTSILEVGEELLLGFQPPEEPDGPPNILFRVFDSKAVEVFGIVGNEIRCHNAAFDIEAAGPYWRIRSKPYKIDIIIRFDPPTRITFERLRFKYLDWELKAEIGSLKLLFDGEPVTLFGGAARISGPCLFRLERGRPSVLMKDMTIEGGAGPAPIGTRPIDAGFNISWPLFGLMNPDDQLLSVVDFHGNKMLGIYTLKSLAKEACPDGLQVTPVSKNQICQIIEDYGNQGLIDTVSFNPTRQMVGFYKWHDFLKNMSGEGDVPAMRLDDDDPLLASLDRRPKAFRYPVHVIVSGDTKAKVHEVEIPTINAGRDVLPIFTDEEQASAALRKLNGNFRIQSLGQSGVVKFLQHFVLPRKISLCVFNPDLESDGGIHQFIDIVTLIADLEKTYTDNKVEEMLRKGDAAEI
jgi:hypothetical protein